jgi:hypothetical protein
MNTQANRTPGPWSAASEYKLNSFLISGADGVYIASCDGESKDGAQDKVENEANAAFIVRACNAHDELVAALRDAEQWISDMRAGDVLTHGRLAILRATLARVQP